MSLGDPIERAQRRRREALARRRARRARILASTLVVIAVIAAATAAYAIFGGHHDRSPVAAAPSTALSDSAPVTTTMKHKKKKKTAVPSRATTSSTTTTPASTATSAEANTSAPASAGTLSAGGALAVSGVRIVQDRIPYGAARRAEMATYAERHYGVHTDIVTPRAIVLHFTAGDTYSSAHNTFAVDTPSGGPAGSQAELPGTCSQFIADQNGTVYQQVPVLLMCRHTIGLNNVAIGIEMVQNDPNGPHAADQAILDRPAQITAVLRLVRALQSRYHIVTSNMIGHATANDSPLFHDREGWTNDHSDWQAADVAEFRRRLGS